MTMVVEAPHSQLGASLSTERAARGLDARIAELCGQRNAVDAQLVDVVAQAATSGAWQGAGIRSLTHWVTWKCGISDRRTRQLVDIAAAADTHPRIIAEFNDGLVSVDQAALAVQCHPVDDDDFSHMARVMTIAQLRIALRAANPKPDPKPDPRPAEPKGESVEMFHGDVGELIGTFCLDPDRGRTLEAAMAEARDRLYRQGQTDVTWADALVDIAQRSLDALPVGRRERYRINIFIDPAVDARATWINGVAIPDAIRDLLLCDGTIIPTFTANGHPVNVGRSQRVVPDRLRRLIEHRDSKCRVPWCARERGLDIHHLIHWSDHGPTVTWNLIARSTGADGSSPSLRHAFVSPAPQAPQPQQRHHHMGSARLRLASLCEHCHRAHHQGQLGITGNADRPDGLIFTNQHGDIIDFAAHPQRPSRPAPTPNKPYRHPDGDDSKNRRSCSTPTDATPTTDNDSTHPNGR